LALFIIGNDYNSYFPAPLRRVLIVKAPPANASWLNYRFNVASRSLAAVLGGYGMASALAAALAVWLPMGRADAVMTGQMLSFVVYACAVIWVFATRSTWRAWGGVLVITAVLLALYALKRWVFGL